MKKALCIMVALAFLMIAAPLSSMAQDMPMGKWWQGPKAAKELNLTKQETEKLDQMYLDHRKKVADLRAQVEKERIELEKMMEADKFDEVAIIAQFGKLEAARTALSKARFGFIMDSRKVLGTERFKKLKMRYEPDRDRMMKHTKDRDRKPGRPGPDMRGPRPGPGGPGPQGPAVD